ncbi:MAG: rRNA pseudouridine synthase [Deltaproteobacteria bacterium]|nr:rRNA pseudouridine synthase [Deltaproteobacteria bacterium]
MVLVRLQKFLSAAGVCSRRQGEKYIAGGLAAVNGRIVTELGTRVDPENDRVEFKGRLIEPRQDLVYIVLNKPKGYVTTCDQSGARIVMDLVDISKRVYPVGRLDKDSTGLLLLTNDGRLHHTLSHPSFDHEKEYDVQVKSPISDQALEKMARGLPMMGTRTREAKITRISRQRFRIVLKEGKNRQIRRMVGKVGNQVGALKRIKMAGIRLGSLEPGAWRFLSAKERGSLLKLL